MEEWAMQHPWMTMFIILGIASNISSMVKYLSGCQEVEHENCISVNDR